MSNAPRIVLRPNPSTTKRTTKQVRDARARAWAFVFQCWHAKKGGPHDLINNPTPKTENGPRETDKENT